MLIKTGQNTYNETETITKYEVMDGTPVKGLKSVWKKS